MLASVACADPPRAAVVGAGVCGLLAAGLLKTRMPGATIDIFETAPEPGGLLAGHRYPDTGLEFDIGTHIFRQTGEPELDQLLRASLPEEAWLTFPPDISDLCGCIFDGQLQKHSPFPDLRNRSERNKGLREIEACLASPGALTIDPDEVATAALRRRFGVTIADELIGPRLSALFGRPIDELSALSLVLAGVPRVLLDDVAEWSKKCADERYRAVVGHPDQLTIDSRFRSPLTSFYPRSGGTGTAIRGLTANLQEHGVNVRCAVAVQAIVEAGGALRLDWAIGGETRHDHYDIVIWTAGLFPLARMLKIDLAEFSFDRPLPHLIAHFRFAALNPNPIYYFNALDADISFFRVTNYAAFAGNELDTRLTVEVLGPRAEDPCAIERIICDLARFGITRGAPMFAVSNMLAAGFPMPTLQNAAALRRLREAALAILPKSLLFCGMQSEPNLFFQNDILRSMHAKVTGASAVAQAARR